MFDAAILILAEYFEFGKGPKSSKPDVDAAIRVLRAAAKVETTVGPVTDFHTGVVTEAIERDILLGTDSFNELKAAILAALPALRDGEAPDGDKK